jgi:hypothetical protein
MTKGVKRVQLRRRLDAALLTRPVAERQRHNRTIERKVFFVTSLKAANCYEAFVAGQALTAGKAGKGRK